MLLILPTYKNKVVLCCLQVCAICVSVILTNKVYEKNGKKKMLVSYSIRNKISAGIDIQNFYISTLMDNFHWPKRV